MLLYWITFSLIFLVVLITFISIFRKSDWWVRVTDFPRIQVSLIGIALLIIYLFVFEPHEAWQFIPIVLLIGAIIYQLYRIHPYALYNKPQVKRNRNKDTGTPFSLMIANVLTPNRQSQKLIKLINKYTPDVILTLETDKWWEEQLSPIEETYTHAVKVPLDNLFGMHLYSRLELVNPEVKYMVQDDIPSIHTRIKLKAGEQITLHCLHPRPPRPTGAQTSLFRDAELLILGRQLEQNNEDVIVAGDLNDVAWSRTSWLFRKVSGLLDPRVGRGLYNTFNAKNPFMRFPLDHVFHSDDFTLNKMKRLPYFGSDHFPIYVSLSYNRKTQHRMNEPEPGKMDEELAKEKIESVEDWR